MAASLKPFVINLNDLAFLLAQVNFVPLFDGPANSNGIVNFDPATMNAWDAKGNPVWDSGTQTGSFNGVALTTANVGLLGTGFPHVSSFIGVRDVSGLHNNLFGTQADWGAVDVPFRRDAGADFSNYVTSAGADYTTSVDGFGVVTQNNVSDFMPRIITRTIVTGDVNLLQDANGHFVEWDPALYATDAIYAALIDNSGVDIANLVEGAKIVAPLGASLSWDPLVYVSSHFYKQALDLNAPTTITDGHLYGSATGGPPVDGQPVYVNVTFNNIGFVPMEINGIPAIFNLMLYGYESLANQSGATLSSLATGDPIAIDTDTLVGVGDVPAADLASLLTSNSGYGMLEQLGHIDFQNPTSGEYFIGSENPGVAPVNSWFGIFGQFFDHGLDLIGKGGQQTKITIQLAPDDPLFNTIGPDGRPVTSFTVTRASVNGTDANGDPDYINHTSPFIDQSQTYGSVDQITQLLRKWVSTDGGTTYHAGIELFDGQTLEDAWMRRWPDGNEVLVHDTLPTLSELRDHVLDTGRAALTWEDVADYRNRDLDTGQLTSGSSGHALILDMNLRFDAAHMASTQAIGTTTVAATVTAAVSALNAGIAATITGMPGYATNNPLRTGGSDALTQNPDGTLNLHLGEALTIQMGPTPVTIPAGDYGGANALMLWVNFADFSIMSPPATPDNAAVGDILMAAVGDHYIAGDGRVNENFGLTSIHHVFHEEHNFQVENLKTWIYAHDANNPGATDPHEQLHAWQIDTGTQDANGNFTYGVGGEIAWDPDKMFEATKLVVEMEYQHAAVDQYARTVTPRIQEFVGYSTGVDATISLEYAQAAFRFGHSTIRETIDAVDPSGWMMGHVTHYALEKAFLNPQQFAETGVAAITLGLTRQQMNEIDEFVTPGLNHGLLDQPLDLAAINIARGRDLGIPTLNDMRVALSLAEYTSWDDFGKGMIHPESLVNFMAAYAFADTTGAVGGIDLSREKAQYILDLANGAPQSVPAGANPFGVAITTAQAVAFMYNQATGIAELDAGRTGFDHIDAWIGGIAEAHVPGGLLGETFDAIFVAQIQSLMDGDRFYYLYRLFGTQIHEEVNNGQFKDIVERNTGLEHLNGSIFAYADKYYDFTRDALPADAVLHNLANTITYYTDKNGQLYDTRTGAGTLADPYVYTGKIDASNPLPVGDTALFDSSNAEVSGLADHGFGLALAENPTLGIHSDGGLDTSNNGTIITVNATDGIRAPVVLSLISDTRPDLQPDLVHPVEGTPTDGADSHEVIVGSDNADFIHARAGDDTVYGEGGDDYIFGDGGVDRLYGNDGNDVIDAGEGPDLVDGGSGKDIIYGRGSGSEVGGFDQLVGGSGNDLVIGGEGIDKLSGGSGDDIIYGDGLTNPEMGNTDAFTHGGDGNDYIDTGASGDLLFGEEGDDYLVGGIDQDLIQGGVGDDIIRPGSPSQAINGGPDEVIGDDAVTNSGFDLIDFSDYAASAPGIVADMVTQFNPLVAVDGQTPFPAWFQIEGVIGTQNNDTFIGTGALNPAELPNPFGGSNWLIGGSGDDTFTGAGGNDLIVGGSIRLDALIGHYDDADFGNLTLGSTEWIQDAMQTGGTGTGYNDNTENAYTGASNRTADADGLTTGGLLAGAGFELHFTEMLKSKMFKDVVLGDNGADGTADIAKFSGNRSEYTVEALDASGAVTTNPALIFAYRVTDTVADRDGTDIVVGIDALQFADITLTSSQFGNAPATGAALLSGFATANTQGILAPLPPFGPLTVDTSTIADADGLGPFSYQWEASADGGVTWTPIAGATTSSYQAQPADLGMQLRAVVTFTDGAGLTERVISAPSDITGEYLEDAPGNVAGELQGGVGQDILIGFGGADQLQGNEGNDWLDGGAGADQMQGGAGNDTYVVDSASDAVTEGANGGIDTVNSSATFTLSANVENLNLTGGANINGTGNALDNVITGNSGNNLLIGGDGNDKIDGGTAGIDTARLAGPSSNYTFAVDATGAVVATDTVGTNGTDTLTNIDRVQFDTTPFYALQSLVNGVGGTLSGTGTTRDLLVGADGADTLTGNGGNDIVFGGAGDDTMSWNVGHGRDVIDGGSSSSTLDGGVATNAGDKFEVNGNAAAEIFNIYAADQLAALAITLGTTFAAGTEIVITRSVGATTAVVAELKSVEELVVNTTAIPGLDPGPFAAGADTVNVFGDFTGLLNPNTITVTSSNGHVTVDVSQMTSDEHVVLNSGGTYEVINGTSNTVDVNATSEPTTAGGDTGGGTPRPTELTSLPVGGATRIGTVNSDIIIGTDTERVIYADAGADVVMTGNGRTVVMAGDGADIVDGGAGGDVIFGDADADIIDAGDGDDRTFGGDGDDLIYGGKGNDILFGGEGRDEIHGGAGNDRIEGGDRVPGGGEADLLFGEDGNDQFVFRTAADANGDVIADFEAGDIIDVSLIDADTTTSGNDSFSILNANTFTASGQLIVHYDATRNATLIEGNTDANTSTSEFQITLEGGDLVAVVQQNGSVII